MMPDAFCSSMAGKTETIAAGEVFALGGALNGGGATQQLVFAPLGGIGEIGMNLSIYGLGDGRREAGWRSMSACPSPPKSICPASI